MITSEGSESIWITEGVIEKAPSRLNFGESRKKELSYMKVYQRVILH